ncbi:hypothetical protein JTB14_034965 [Gonioctena quinquepunctata]|nr:hypothetical protein JTB14_034965 [Gonioctena quinquepunctata]
MKIYDELPFGIIDEDGDDSHGYGERGVLVGPKKYFLDRSYKQHGLNIYNFQARRDDICLIGLPRSGTALHCEMIWLIGNDLDYEGASKHPLTHRFPLIDNSLYDKFYNSGTGVDTGKSEKSVSGHQTLSFQDLDEIEGKRYLKSHLPLSLNPPSIFEVGAKVIYCARHPKDLMVSMYRLVSFFSKMINSVISFEEFSRMFINDRGLFLPYFENVKEAWARRNDKDFLFLFYENTIKDKRQAIISVSEFLGKNLSTNEITTLENHLSIDEFKKNQSVNSNRMTELGGGSADIPYINKAKPEGWEGYFGRDLQNEVDRWIEENLRGTDLKFPDV